MSNLDLSKIDVHTLNSNLERALWTIYILTSKEKDRFGQSEVANYLVEKSGIDITKQAVDMALKSKTANGFINKNKSGFKIMKSGIDFLLAKPYLGALPREPYRKFETWKVSSRIRT